MKLNKLQFSIKKLHNIGFRVIGSEVFTPHGRLAHLTVKTSQNKRYLCIPTYNSGKMEKVEVYLLAAYQKFGDQIFDKKYKIIQSDGDTLNYNMDNIELQVVNNTAMEELNIFKYYQKVRDYKLVMEKFNITDIKKLYSIINRIKIKSKNNKHILL